MTPDSVKFIADSNGVRTEAEWTVSRQLKPIVKGALFVVFALSPLVAWALAYQQTERHNKEVFQLDEERNKEERRRNDLAQEQAAREQRGLELWKATLDTAKEAFPALARAEGAKGSEPVAEPTSKPPHLKSADEPRAASTAPRVNVASEQSAGVTEVGAEHEVVVVPGSASPLVSAARSDSARTSPREAQMATAATTLEPTFEPTPDSVDSERVKTAVERAQWQLEANDLALLEGIKRDADRRGSSTYHVAQLPLKSAKKLRSTADYSIYELHGVTVTLRHHSKWGADPLVTSIEIGS